MGTQSNTYRVHQFGDVPALFLFFILIHIRLAGGEPTAGGRERDGLATRPIGVRAGPHGLLEHRTRRRGPTGSPPPEACVRMRAVQDVP